MLEHTAQALGALELAGLLLLQSGGETYRVEETIQRMGAGFGYPDTRVLCFQTGVCITLCVEGIPHSSVRRVQRRGVNLWRVDEVNRVSRLAASGGLSPVEALEALTKIHESPPLKPWTGALFSGLAAGGFALMLGAGPGAFLISMLSGMAARALSMLLDRLDLHLVLSSLFGGFVCAGLAVLAWRLWGVTMEPIIAGALMPLLPGVAMTNAVRDTMRGDLLSGVTRGVEALLVAILLAAGVVLALWLGGGGV